MTLQLIFWTKDFIKFKLISEIDVNGFTITPVMKNQKSLRLKWDEIKYFKLDDSNNLTAIPIKGKSINIEHDYIGWYGLLKKIPSSKLIDSQIPDFLDEIFTNLSSCQICGNIALYKEKCLYCRSIVFNEELKEEFLNEKEYVKFEQLELFCTDDKDEKVDFYLNDDDDLFERDKNWKPIVSEKEVIEYSTEHYWD